MHVVISAGGRFHAYHLAKQLIKRNALERLYTFAYTKHDEQIIPATRVINNQWCQTADYLFSTLRLSRLCNRSTYNRIKDTIFDNFVTKQLANEKHIDLFVGWAHYAENSLLIARQKGAKIIIESGSCHITSQQNLIKLEYDRWGLTVPAVAQKTKEKMLREYALADYIMTPSHFVRDSFIRQGTSPKKLLMVPYGADVSFFTPAPTLHKDFTLLFVGMVSLRKGISYLLQAWDKANLPIRGTKLKIVGTLQKDFLSIQAKLPKNGNVEFIGGVDRNTLKNLYQGASAFVIPSIEEGLAMVISEAMASGLPVIASTHSGGAERIVHGKTGFLYNPYNVDELARLITWCYENRQAAHHIGQTAHNYIQTCSWDAYGDNVYRAYQAIIGHE
jgi:starch synthase